LKLSEERRQGAVEFVRKHDRVPAICRKGIVYAKSADRIGETAHTDRHFSHAPMAEARGRLVLSPA
jgi:hypothetical protein